MEPNPSLVSADPQGATDSKAARQAKPQTELVGVPWGGPAFTRLVLLFSASFLATSSIILGSWFLVFRPAPVDGVPPSPPAAAEVP